MFKVFAVIIAGTLGFALAAHAEWPSDQPIRVIVPQPAGGTNDTVARLISSELGKALNQSVVVENRPGASGSIGTQALIQAAPDGYTLGIASDSSTIVGAVRPSISWKFDEDVSGVAKVADQPICVATSTQTGYKTLDDLVAAAKKAPGTIAFGSSGAGSSQHIVGEWLSGLAGIKLIHVPYKGGGQAIMDLVGGQIPAAVLGCAPVIGQRDTGAVRILAVTSTERNPALPDVPTLTELGYPQIALAQWVGFIAPKGVPDAILQRTSDEITAILEKEEIKSKLLQAGLDARPMPTTEFDQFLHETVSNWKTVVNELNITLE